jgi:hypothetical protein
LEIRGKVRPDLGGDVGPCVEPITHQIRHDGVAAGRSFHNS